jgi:signal peptidase II
MTRSWRWVTAVIAGIIAFGVSFDQVTKAWAISRLAPGQRVSLIGDLLEFSLIRNPGAAFGRGTSLTVVFAALGVIVLIFLAVFALSRVRCTIWAIIIGLGMAVVLGNLIDRMVRPPGFMFGHVIDFISLKYFAVFNVADMMLTGAAALAIMVSLFPKISWDGSRLKDTVTKV